MMKLLIIMMGDVLLVLGMDIYIYMMGMRSDLEQQSLVNGVYPLYKNKQGLLNWVQSDHSQKAVVAQLGI